MRKIIISHLIVHGSSMCHPCRRSKGIPPFYVDLRRSKGMPPGGFFKSHSHPKGSITQKMSQQQDYKVELSFSCHCGFMKCKTKQKSLKPVSSDSPLELTVLDCNCSMCRRKGFLHHIVSEKNFQSPNELSQLHSYSFQTHVAKHYFCPVCGICTFYKPRSNPDGWSVNFRCIDDESVKLVKHVVELFDGQNWEENGQKIKHLSE